MEVQAEVCIDADAEVVVHYEDLGVVLVLGTTWMEHQVGISCAVRFATHWDHTHRHWTPNIQLTTSRLDLVSLPQVPVSP